MADANRNTDDKAADNNSLRKEEQRLEATSSRTRLLAFRLLDDFGAAGFLRQELGDLVLDDIDRRQILEWIRARLHVRHMPGVTALVLRQTDLERAGLRAVRFHLADIHVVRLLAIDVRLAQSHIRGDVAGGGLRGFGATEEFEETAASSFKDEEGGSAHAIGILFHAPSGDVLELVARGIEILDHAGFLVAHIESFQAAGERNNIDLGTEFLDFLIRLGNPVMTRRNETLVDRSALGKQLEATEELGVPRHLLELLVGSELRGGKLGEIDID